MKRNLKRYSQAGFSLLEIMVVVVIIGMLAATVTVSVIHLVDKARVTKAQSEVGEFSKALNFYKMEYGNYPTTAQGLTELTKPARSTNKAFLPGIPDDPWGRKYRYSIKGDTFEIICLGADGRDGGSGFEADIKASDLLRGNQPH